jgi:hypothetical protein
MDKALFLRSSFSLVVIPNASGSSRNARSRPDCSLNRYQPIYIGLACRSAALKTLQRLLIR